MNGGLWFYDYEIVVIDAFSFRLILGIEIAKVKKRKKILYILFDFMYNFKYG